MASQRSQALRHQPGAISPGPHACPESARLHPASPSSWADLPAQCPLAAGEPQSLLGCSAWLLLTWPPPLCGRPRPATCELPPPFPATQASPPQKCPVLSWLQAAAESTFSVYKTLSGVHVGVALAAGCRILPPLCPVPSLCLVGFVCLRSLWLDAGISGRVRGGDVRSKSGSGREYRGRGLRALRRTGRVGGAWTDPSEGRAFLRLSLRRSCLWLQTSEVPARPPVLQAITDVLSGCRQVTVVTDAHPLGFCRGACTEPRAQVAGQRAAGAPRQAALSLFFFF